jgi:hypothetical protein
MSPKAGAVSWCDGGCDGMRDEGPMSTEHGLAIQTAGTWFRKEKAGSKEGPVVADVGQDPKIG